MRRGTRSATLAVWAWLSACGSVDVLGQAERFRAGDVDGLHSELAELGGGGGDGHLWLMQRSMVDLARGRPKEGISALRTARNRLDELRSAVYGRWIEAAFFDDRMLAYEGADYEHVLVRAILALQDLVDGGREVHAYLNQMLERQVEIREQFVTDDGKRPKLGYRSAAIGNWLLAAIEADDPTRGSDVVRQLQAVLEHEPRCQLAQGELERFRREGFAPPGHGVVQVVALLGLGPYRIEREEPVSSVILHAAQAIYNAHRGRAALPVNLVGKVKIPVLAMQRDNPTAMDVRAGSVQATTETITSVEALAASEFEAMRTQVVTRAVLRRLFKLVLAEVGKEATRKRAPENETEEQRRERERENQNRSALWDLLTLVTVAVEAADVRCWSLLPASFQAARLVLPAGEHDIVLHTHGGARHHGAQQAVRVVVREGRTTFVVAQAPGGAVAPAALTSDPAR